MGLPFFLELGIVPRMEKNLFPMILEKINSGQIQRINVVGTSGSGKSTFAKSLASKLRCKYVEMDKLFWEPHWQEKEDQRFFSDLEAALHEDRWVLDGNYFRTQPIKWKRVDLVIWLDFSFLLTFTRALKRSIVRAITKVELWQGTGNKESFRKTFFHKDSILWWTITSYSRNKERYLKLDEQCSNEFHVAPLAFGSGDGSRTFERREGEKSAPFLFLRLKNPQQAAKFLENIPCAKADSSAI